jgi:hypothetical protein
MPRKAKTLFAHGHTSTEVENFSENEICFKTYFILKDDGI